MIARASINPEVSPPTANPVAPILLAKMGRIGRINDIPIAPKKASRIRMKIFLLPVFMLDKLSKLQN
jgi:hypothetical protein